jgi:hypothetical protein
MFGVAIESRPIRRPIWINVPEGALDRMCAMQIQIDALQADVSRQAGFIAVLKAAIDEKDEVIAALRSR